MDNNDTFVIYDVVFKVGDIVEKHYNGQWRYWTTIHNRVDALAFLLLDQTFHRVSRYTPKVQVLWLT